WIARNRIELPRELPGVRVEGRKESADRKLVPAHTHNDFPFRNARLDVDGVIVLRKRDAGIPYWSSDFRIERFNPPANDGIYDLALVNRDSTMHNPAADLRSKCSLVDFGIPAPTFLTGARIDGENDAPICDSVQRPVPH